jgi:polyisoprenoid-binding protein YceI
MIWRTIVVASLLTTPLAKAAQERTAYSIDTAQSKLEIHVYKEGAFKVFGHDHLIVAKDISGEAQFDAQKIDDSKVSLRITTRSLTVVDPGESEKDRREVQKTMEGEKVLDVDKFPEITFTATSVSAVKKIADRWELTLSGPLKLHGVEKAVTFPLQVHVEEDRLRGQGQISLLQTDYGITPVKVGGGAVKVKDRLKIDFTIMITKVNR